MSKLIRPQTQIFSDLDPDQRAWRATTELAYKQYMLAHGRAPTSHIEYVQLILFVAKVLFDKFGNVKR